MTGRLIHLSDELSMLVIRSHSCKTVGSGPCTAVKLHTFIL